MTLYHEHRMIRERASSCEAAAKATSVQLPGKK